MPGYKRDNYFCIDHFDTIMAILSILVIPVIIALLLWLFNTVCPHEITETSNTFKDIIKIMGNVIISLGGIISFIAVPMHLSDNLPSSKTIDYPLSKKIRIIQEGNYFELYFRSLFSWVLFTGGAKPEELKNSYRQYYQEHKASSNDKKDVYYDGAL